MAERSLVVVNYRSAALCREAVASARAASAEPLEVVVVDNSCDADEVCALEESGADRIVVAEENLGYAAGANRGIAASSGEVVIVSNPDVVFGAGCIDHLAASLGGGVALAGPRISWDSAGDWLLPPAEMATLAGEVARRIAGRSASFARRRAAARFFGRVSFWRDASPRRVEAVSGAVMAIDRRAWLRAGRFDERYRLYFEEIDFMRSLRRDGLEILHVPAARCRHIYDQSAASESEHRAKYGESERIYLEKWHGPLVGLLGLLDRMPLPAAPRGTPDAVGSVEVPEPAEAHVVEASPLESFETAAGHFPAGGRVEVPSEIRESFRGDVLHLRVVEAATGREVARGALDKSA